MKITFTLSDGSEWEELTVNPSTLITTDSANDTVALFGRGLNVEGVANLRDVIEAGCRAEGRLS